MCTHSNDFTYNGDEFVYVLVISAPSHDSHTSFALRKGKEPKRWRSKNINCPYCGKYFDSVDTKTKVEVFRGPKKTTICHSVRRCKLCNETVGIKYA